MADNSLVMSPALLESLTNILPAQSSPKGTLQVVREAALDVVFSRITNFLANLDFNQFYAIFPVASPVYRFVRTFDPELFIAMVVQALQAPKAEASKKEVQAIIDAKLSLEKRLAYLEWIFGLVKAAGLDDGGVVLSLAWLAKRNQESFSELNMRRTLHNLGINASTTNNASGNSQPPSLSPSHTMVKFPEDNHGLPIPVIRVFPPASDTPDTKCSDPFQDEIAQDRIVQVKNLSLHVLNSLRDYEQLRIPRPIDVQTAREMAGQRGRPGGKLTNKEPATFSNPCPSLEYRHPWSASPFLDKYPEYQIPFKKVPIYTYRTAPEDAETDDNASDVPLWRRSAPTAARRSDH